jgi:hypothetical protein
MATKRRVRFRALQWAAAILGMAFVGIQFIRPKVTNPPVTAELQAPPEVKQILQHSCYNCHSNQTKLSWFDRPVPAYWIVAQDVNEARKRVNFSEIGKLPAAQQQGILYEAISQISFGTMPLPAYKRFHPGATVTREQLAVLKKYLLSIVGREPATPTAVTAANTQYEKWIQSDDPAPSVAPAPNGIAFMPEYRDWKAISSTGRFDNSTIRVILGNEVAVQAIAENHINPWPDGTSFAKVAWLQQRDNKGVVHAGAFFQVEFMVRDSKKYAGTLGWGWARWRGADLKPYGKDASFTNECVGCHNPLGNTDHVFTTPIRGQQWGRP